MKKLGPPYARPELRGRYLIREPVKAMAMAGVDLALSALPRRRPPMPRHPKRILICNWAHLGDVVLTVPAIVRLREVFPDATFDYLASTGSQAVAANVAGVERVHLLDHWSLNRAAGSTLSKRALYVRQRRSVIADLARGNYDLAIDFYQHYPTAAFELWRAGIPVRIGYSSGGMSPLLTATVDWTQDDRHVIERHKDLLDIVFGCATGPLAAAYPRPPAESEAQVRKRSLPRSYVLIHTGSGGIPKEWSEASWLELVQALTARGERIILAGAGAREGARNARLASSAPGIVDLTNQIDWPGFTALVAGARVLIGLDSVCAHLGAAYGIPSVVIRSGAVSNRVWGPLNPSAVQLTAPTPCAPCHRLGCDTMACLVGISAADVLRAFERLTLRSPVVSVALEPDVVGHPS